MKDLSKAKKKELLEKLLKEEERLVKLLKTIGIEDKSQGGFRSTLKDGENLGQKEEEAAQETANMGIKFEEERVSEYKLRKVKEAIQRLKAGDESYGWCEECGKKINSKRLNYDPTVDLCVKCAEEK